MSLIGPRPEQERFVSQYHRTIPYYSYRQMVKPGITGWAQIKGWRGEIDQPEKLKKRYEHDLYYIENWSLLLDIYILVMTPISLVAKTEGAY